MAGVVIVILVLAFVVVVCAVGVETLRRVNRPSIPPVAPSQAEVQLWHVARAFGNDSQSTEIANLWFRLNEVCREELLFYGRGLVLPAVFARDSTGKRDSGIVAKGSIKSVADVTSRLDVEADRATTLTPIAVDIVAVERDRPSKRPTMLTTPVDAPRPTVVEAGSMCAICDALIGRHESQASDGYGVTWHSRCLSQAGKRNRDRNGAV
jgi:hypothetical protein